MKRISVFRVVLPLALCMIVLADADKIGPADIPIFNKPSFAGATRYYVTGVTGAAVIEVTDLQKTSHVRLAGVDAKAMLNTSPDAPACSQEAKRFPANFLKGETVYLVSDPNGPKADSKGRRIAYAYRGPDGLLVNAEIIRQGYARAAGGSAYSKAEKFRRLERFAKQAGKGLWALDAKTKPAEKAITVYVTKTGSKYHRADCDYLRHGSTAITLTQAKARDNGPCRKCSARND